MNAILLDTNVWLDYHLAESPGHDAALALIDAALNNDIALLIASHSLKDFWYIFGQHVKMQCKLYDNVSDEQAALVGKRMAWGFTEQIMNIATVVSSGMPDAWLALKMKNTHNDYEDNLVIATALRVQPRMLVTSDKALLAHCPVAAATPADALMFLDLV